MTILEIILLVLGAACLAAGIFIPEKTKAKTSWEERKETERIKELIENEIEKYKVNLKDSLEEEVSEYLEKAERGLERISNEKIMAVNEYGDTVLKDINKNHEEAVFLYDMLNNKHDDILKSQAELESTSRDVKNTLQAIESAKDEANADFEKNKSALIQEFEQKENEIELEKNKLTALEEEFNKNRAKMTASNTTAPASKRARKTVKRNPDSMLAGSNHNEEILRLYKEGKSNVAIAKELGLGVGEVKLVIDLAKM
ncbi:MAG: hypothetical protein K5776_08595 [Lachnospiraceae bacterium]|nr:hypothetical protein [Lachnospiraceae bacterium]